MVLVCEHGNYPHNEKNQQLYPRYEFFEQVVKVFKDSGRSCPVFTDKHLSYDWKKGQTNVRLVAGVEVSAYGRLQRAGHVPAAGYDPPLGSEMESALSVGGGWVADGGIFHILDTLQAFVERRKGGEAGVRAVQMLKGMKSGKPRSKASGAATYWMQPSHAARRCAQISVPRICEP